jgi:hypothetical protein
MLSIAVRASRFRDSRALLRISAAVISGAIAAGCASAPPPPSQSPGDPSNPAAAEMSRAPMTTPAASAADPGPTVTAYACPMHPEVTSTQPGQKCPKCGMTLVPRKATP